MTATGGPRCDISRQQAHTGWKPTIDHACPSPLPGVNATGKNELFQPTPPPTRQRPLPPTARGAVPFRQGRRLGQPRFFLAN